ncbi:hypothetical protein VNO77_08843 [Canavalia gladiata]|uniref:Uncharacterized protein n=1 Tax=Canavalia gladiata TaxID=3824 RepID=A0AAN9M9H8_CANGL
MLVSTWCLPTKYQNPTNHSTVSFSLTYAFLQPKCNIIASLSLVCGDVYKVEKSIPDLKGGGGDERISRHCLYYLWKSFCDTNIGQEC